MVGHKYLVKLALLLWLEQLLLKRGVKKLLMTLKLRIGVSIITKVSELETSIMRTKRYTERKPQNIRG